MTKLIQEQSIEKQQNSFGEQVLSHSKTKGLDQEDKRNKIMRFKPFLTLYIVIIGICFFVGIWIFQQILPTRTQNNDQIRMLLSQDYLSKIGSILQTKRPDTNYRQSKKQVGTIHVDLGDRYQYILPFEKSVFITFKKTEEKPPSKIVYTPKEGKNTNENQWKQEFEVIKSKGKHNQAIIFVANMNSKDPNIDFFQYQYFNEKYNLDQQVQQNNFCLISPSRNLISRSGQASFKVYLDSLENQNYSNFQVFLNDDASDDNSPKRMIDIIDESYPRLKNRVTIVKNIKNIGALGNRDITARNYCKNGSIIAQIDADDALLGKQVLNLMNRIYVRNPNTWFVYSSFLRFRYNQNKINKGQFSSIKDESFILKRIDWQQYNSSNYRTDTKIWGTSHLKTYLKDLYLKTPLDYFFQNGSYHLLATDRFNVYAMIELAGSSRIKYIDELLYVYRNLIQSNKNKCHYQYSYVKEYQARQQIPLLPLQSLKDKAMKTKKYRIPRKVVALNNQYKKRYAQCLHKYYHQETVKSE